MFFFIDYGEEFDDCMIKERIGIKGRKMKKKLYMMKKKGKIDLRDIFECLLENKLLKLKY